MRKEFRKKGLMTEALQTIIAFGFQILKLNSVKAYTALDNYKTIALLKKLGFIDLGKELNGYYSFEQKKAHSQYANRLDKK